MTLAPGTNFGPYEILGPLGAGGMGEVHRARDRRLDRDVAIKVLPAHLSADAAALVRFEREAKAIAALSHPNILAVHDFGAVAETRYVVMELLEGETLRARLEEGSIPPRKAVEWALQIVRGLDAAHAKGVVHRDLKPENVFITREGLVKILDFGLARSEAAARTEAGGGVTHTPTRTSLTDPGTVMGTVGYMAPEQVRGRQADHRADIFAFGAVLYEMLSGRRPFERESAAETISAVLRDDPPPLDPTGALLPPGLEPIVRRCLEKRPEERFQTARDLAFALETAVGASGPATAALKVPGGTGRRVSLAAAIAVAGALAVVGLLAGAFVGRRAAGAASTPSNPSFTKLTYERGMLLRARFAPDGKTVVYGAAWNGAPTRVFLSRVDSAESTPLQLPDAELFSVSSKGELAISLGHTYKGWMGEGTLARVPLLGGAPRQLLEHVREAEWTPDGSDLAVVRRVGDGDRLEFPVGEVLYQTSGYISHIRFSPQGDRIAFADHPVFADDLGGVAVVDLKGHRKTLSSGWISVSGIAWSPDGREVWFSATPGKEESAVRAVTLGGEVRLVLGGVASVRLFDIAADGHVLLGREISIKQVEGLLAGFSSPRDLSLVRESSASFWIAPDGRSLTLNDQTVEEYATYLARSDGAPAVELGPGQALGASPDGRWVLTQSPTDISKLTLLPAGSGSPRRLANPERIEVGFARWLHDGRRIVFVGQAPGRQPRVFVQNVPDGAPRAVSPEGLSLPQWWTLPLAPDDSRVVVRDSRGGFVAQPLNGGAPTPLTALRDEDAPIEWSADGGAVFVTRSGPPWIVERVELASGRRTRWMEIDPHEKAGMRLGVVLLSPDGKYWSISTSRTLVDLIEATGLK